MLLVISVLMEDYMKHVSLELGLTGEVRAHQGSPEKKICPGAGGRHGHQVHWGVICDSDIGHVIQVASNGARTLSGGPLKKCSSRPVIQRSINPKAINFCF